MATKVRERKPSTSAQSQSSKVNGPSCRPKHKRTFTGFGAGEIKSVEASIRNHREASVFISNNQLGSMLTLKLQVEEVRKMTVADKGTQSKGLTMPFSLPTASRPKRNLRYAPVLLNETVTSLTPTAERNRPPR
jgi:starch phosphorylase